MGNLKKCVKCGTLSVDNATQCGRCGYVFPGAVQQMEATEERQAPETTAAPVENTFRPAVGAETEEKYKNTVAGVLKILAVLIFIGSFIAGIVVGKEVAGMTLVYWIAGLFAGTMLLGFSEIVRLLHEINRKMKLISS